MSKIEIFLITVICIICLAGCNSQIEEDIIGVEDSSVNIESTIADSEIPQYNIDFAPNRINITEYQSRYEVEINEVKESDYNNMNLKDCEISSIEGVKTVGVYRSYSENMGVDESIEAIENRLKEIGCEDIELEAELRDASGQYERGNGQYPYDYPAVFDYYPEFDSGRGFFINTNKCYIQMGNDGIYSMSDGSITAFLNSDSLAAMDALGINEENIVDQGMVSRMGDAVWELTDGEISVADAAAVAKNYFEAGTPRQNPNGISVDIPEVKVFALNDKYGYSFKVRRVYNGLPFAYAATSGRTYYGSDYEIVEDMKTAYVINHDKVAAYTGYSDAEQIEALTEEQTDIIGLKDAVSLLNEFLAVNVMLEVNRADLVYCTCADKAGDKIVYPCWQFDGVNQTNNQSMRFYINVFSGDIYYYSYVEE